MSILFIELKLVKLAEEPLTYPLALILLDVTLINVLSLEINVDELIVDAVIVFAITELPDKLPVISPIIPA